MAGALPSVQPPAPTPLQQPNPLINPPGMVEPGNLDPFHRRTLDNKNGTFSTTLSFSIGGDKGETLIPQVVKGQLLTKREAIAHYMKTGQHRVFSTHRKAQTRILLPCTTRRDSSCCKVPRIYSYRHHGTGVRSNRSRAMCLRSAHLAGH